MNLFLAVSYWVVAIIIAMTGSYFLYCALAHGGHFIDTFLAAMFTYVLLDYLFGD